MAALTALWQPQSVLGEAIKDASAVYRQAADDAYAALGKTDASIAGNFAVNLDKVQKRGAEMDGAIIDATTPIASNALELIRNRMAGGEKGAIAFSRIEQTRQQPNRLQSAAMKGDNGADQMAIAQIKKGYDTWMDRLFTRAMLDGDEAILAKAQTARKAWDDRKRAFFAQGKGDDAGRAMQNLVEIDATPNEMSSLLWGANAVGEKGVSARLAGKLKEALPEGAWNNVRAGAWLKVAEPPSGKAPFGPTRLANRIEAFVSGNGSALAKQLYTPQELALMSRLAQALRILAPPAQAINPSKTAYANARLAQDTFRSLAGMLGYSQGGAAGGLGAVLASAIPGAIRNTIRAKCIPATRATTPSVSLPGGGGAAGGIGSQYSQ